MLLSVVRSAIHYIKEATFSERSANASVTVGVKKKNISFWLQKVIRCYSSSLSQSQMSTSLVRLIAHEIII